MSSVCLALDEPRLDEPLFESVLSLPARPHRRVRSTRPHPATVAEWLVDTLCDAGTRAVFGLPGEAIAPLHLALAERADLRVLTLAHGVAAVRAACGYAWASGQPGVVFLPSWTEAIAAFPELLAAHEAGVPLLVLVGDPGCDGSRGGDPGLVAMARPLVKRVLELTRPAMAKPLLALARATAVGGRPGPVLVSLPLGVATAAVEVASSIALRPELPDRIEPWALERAVALLRGSDRTAILAGAGLRAGAGSDLGAGDGPARLRELAEWTGWPVLTTPLGKGVFPETHRQALGVLGPGGHPSVRDFVAGGLDVLLAAGVSWREPGLAMGDLALRQGLIQLDLDAAELGRGPWPELGIAAPPSLVLAKLRALLRPAHVEQRYRLRTDAEPALDRLGEGTISFPRVIWELQQLLPPETIFVCEEGEPFEAALQGLTLARADTFVPVRGGAGAGVAVALGVQLAQPRRQVVVLSSGQGLPAGVAELSAAVAERLPLLVVALRAPALGRLERSNLARYGRTPHASPATLDAALLAAAAGAEAEIARAPGDVLALAPALRRPARPLLLEV